MALITLKQAKAQCRVTNSAEDSLIQTYIDGVIDYIQIYLDRTDLPETPGLISAALMMVEDRYYNRGAMVDGSLKPNPAVEALLFQQRKGLGI